MFDKEQECFVMSHAIDFNIRVVSHNNILGSLLLLSFPNEHIFTLLSDDTNSL